MAAYDVFGSPGKASTNLTAFKQWLGVLDRIKDQAKKVGDQKCSSKNELVCKYAKFYEYLQSIKNEPELDKIKKLNSIVNRGKYIQDPKNWTQKDYWNTPLEFLAKFGDCEDFAIIKFIGLEILGFPPEAFRLVAVNDLNLGVGHAVLIVHSGDKTYLLDNQIKQLIETTAVKHYQPVYSINRQKWWRHKQ